MSKRIYMILWIFAALIAVLLLAVTAGLTIKARAQADSSITVYVGGKSRLVHLRKEPDSISRIMGMLERGTAVAVIDSAIKNRQTWYHIETESASGWIQAQYISLNRP